MTVSIEYLSGMFKLTGDGVATSASLSRLEAPFAGLPAATPASVFVNADGGGRISSVAVNGSVIDFTFTSAFSGQSGSIQIGLNYDVA